MTVFRRDLTTVAQAKAVLRVMGMEERATELKILYLGNERCDHSASLLPERTHAMKGRGA